MNHTSYSNCELYLTYTKLSLLQSLHTINNYWWITRRQEQLHSTALTACNHNALWCYYKSHTSSIRVMQNRWSHNKVGKPYNMAFCSLSRGLTMVGQWYVPGGSQYEPPLYPSPFGCNFWCKLWLGVVSTQFGGRGWRCPLSSTVVASYRLPTVTRGLSFTVFTLLQLDV